MGRAWRIEFDGAFYHVMSRGNEGRNIFFCDDDRQGFLGAVCEISERFEIDIFAFVLMDNHYHLLIRTRRANLSKAMQWLGVTYTRRFNNKHSRIGHLFQGRFKSIIVQNDIYLMQLSCYIHRNPLRAGAVNRLARYPWSSYPVYAYGNKGPQWLSTELILSQFDEKSRHRDYREKVQGYAKEEKRLLEDLKHGMILGSKRFVDNIRSTYLPQVPHREIPQQKSMFKEFNPVSFLDKAAKILNCDIRRFQQSSRISSSDKEDRDILVYALWKTGILTNEKIGQLFGVTSSSISHSVRALSLKLKKDRQVRDKLDQIYSLFKI
jgi:REP element-mobilizing transposase RayT